MKKELWELLFEAIYSKDEVIDFAKKYGIDYDIIDKFQNQISTIRQNGFPPINDVSIQYICNILKPFQKKFLLIAVKFSGVDFNLTTDIKNFIDTCNNMHEYCTEIINRTIEGDFSWI